MTQVKIKSQQTKISGRLADAPAVPATHAFHARVESMNTRPIAVERWLLVNQRTRTLTSITTYTEDDAPPRCAIRYTVAVDLFNLFRRLADYQEVAIEECPLARRDPYWDAYSDWQWIGS
jgi:hypothetical protein